MQTRKIAVLLVEDSVTTRLFLTHLLESDPQIQVIGAVRDGQAALDFVRETQPDVVVMDIHMPRLDGFEATRLMMESHPVPIIICSATANIKDTVVTFRAMEAGAIACVEKPASREDRNLEDTSATLLQTVKLMSEVKVVRRYPRLRPAPNVPAQTTPRAAEFRLIGIGASTGGPPVLQTILGSLPKDFATPILVVQHIARGFVAGMAEWLNHTTALQIHIASHGTYPQPGHVYLAPDDFHMGVGNGGAIVLSREPPHDHLRPAVSFLFRSLAETCGANALGVLLTGMGRDGAEELKAMKDRGAITIAQDKESSAVHGMPGAAIELGGATHVLPPERIAQTIITLVNQRTRDARGLRT
ncbi:MAG: response regulator receiver (CheY-like) modulated CheB methylesterase [Betaproteobacteria bacterium]|nr:response regulator receiver (CheY-like) modulated CheB methylesterase [Betaproteobacteria bacterium]